MHMRGSPRVGVLVGHALPRVLGRPGVGGQGGAEGGQGMLQFSQTRRATKVKIAVHGRPLALGGRPSQRLARAMPSYRPGTPSGSSAAAAARKSATCGADRSFSGVGAIGRRGQARPKPIKIGNFSMYSRRCFARRQL